MKGIIKEDLKMETNINELLDEEIVTEIQNLSEMEDGTDEKSQAIDNLTKLHKLRIEEIKCRLDAEEKNNRRIMEQEEINNDDKIKLEQINEQIKDRYFRLGISVGELLIPLIFYGIWMKKGFKFEETGTYTSKTFTGLINRFKPTKK
jgi:hypothetical protein